MNKITVPMLLLVTAFSGCSTLNKAMPISRLSKPDTERAISMARLMERHGKVEESSQLYQGVLKTDPKNQLAHHRLGILAARRGEHDVALDHFNDAATCGEPTSQLLNDIGYTRYLKNELDLAEDNLRESLRINPQFKAAHSNLGLVLAEQGKFDEALVEFGKAGNEAAALSNLAFIQTKLGHLAEGEKNYHKVLDLDPTHRPAAEALVQFQSIRNKADAMLAKMEREAKTHDEPIVAVIDSKPAIRLADEPQPITTPRLNKSTQEVTQLSERTGEVVDGVVQVNSVESLEDPNPVHTLEFGFQPPIKVVPRGR
jgi:Tfp pilus assembly protein PilF